MRNRCCKLILNFLIAILLFSTHVNISARAEITKSEFYKKVICYEAEYGLYQDWDVDRKIMMVGWMQEVGISVDTDQANELFDNAIDAKHQEEIADNIVEGYYGPGRGGAITILDIIGKDMGDYDSWSIEDKAWLTQIQQEDGVFNNRELSGLYVVNLLPDSALGDISQEEAITLAMNASQKAFGFMPGELHNMELNLFFILSSDTEYRLPGDSNNYCNTLRLWMVRYQSTAGEYSVQIRNDGVILSFSTPESNFFADELLEKTPN